MPKIPFPHILTYPANNSFPPRGKVVRIVHDEDVANLKIQTTVTFGKDIRYATFAVFDILNQRLARGDWSAWEKHPTYFECVVGEVVDERTGTTSDDPNYLKMLQKK